MFFCIFVPRNKTKMGDKFKISKSKDIKSNKNTKPKQKVYNGRILTTEDILNDRSKAYTFMF